MNDRDKIIRLATEVMGWKVDLLSTAPWIVVANRAIVVRADHEGRPVIWSPLESIADAYSMESAIPEKDRADYLGHLECICVPNRFNEDNPAHIWALVHATPRQRVDAAIAMLEGR